MGEVDHRSCGMVHLGCNHPNLLFCFRFLILSLVVRYEIIVSELRRK